MTIVTDATDQAWTRWDPTSERGLHVQTHSPYRIAANPSGCTSKRPWDQNNYAVWRNSAIETMHKAAKHAIHHTADALCLSVRLYERVRDVQERLHPRSASQICTGARRTDCDKSPKGDMELGPRTGWHLDEDTNSRSVLRDQLALPWACACVSMNFAI